MLVYPNHKQKESRTQQAGRFQITDSNLNTQNWTHPALGSSVVCFSLE